MNTVHLSRRRFLVGMAGGSCGAILGHLGCSKRSGTTFDRDPARLDLVDASRAVRTQVLSPVDLTRACLDRIERLDPQLNSFITVTAERALAEARQAEAEIVNGRWRGPLHGVPIALKDNIDTAGVRTTAGSAVFLDRVPTEDAEVVVRLKAAGAVILGKLNLHEFALGTTSAISHFGAVHNPWDLERVAGGSSGGAGAAVAASLCFGAVGTDTGGSIRIPAAACGIVGLKPTNGVVSSRGVIPISTTVDCVGPMCRTVADAAVMFRAMTDHPLPAEYDPEAPQPTSDFRVGLVGKLRSLCGDVPVAEEVQRAVDAAVDVIRTLVADVGETELPMPENGSDIIAAEGYTYHARHIAQTPDLYDPRTRAVAAAGQEISDAELGELRERLERYRAEVLDSFSTVDLVAMPTLPSLPVTIREAGDSFAQPFCTLVFNLAGLPAISLPCGLSRSGLPIGLLIGGPPFSEPHLLALAQTYERVAEWRPTEQLGLPFG